MRNMLLVVPSRGRPASIARLWNAVQETCEGDTTLLVGLDEDDPLRNEYPEGPDYEVRSGLRQVVAWINVLALPRAGNYQYIGHFGDDNLPRTSGWDKQVMAALEQTPFAFCNDLYPREPGSLCCHIFMRSEVVSKLGYMGPPVFRHMYVDPVWMAWGIACGITYLHEVVLEHLHYSAGKSPYDDTYNDSLHVTVPDLAAFHSYCAEDLNKDIEKIKPGVTPFTSEDIVAFKQRLNIPDHF